MRKEFSFVCEICEKAFTRKYFLSQHITTIHLNQPFPRLCCDICDKIYRKKYELTRHIMDVHFDFWDFAATFLKRHSWKNGFLFNTSQFSIWRNRRFSAVTFVTKYSSVKKTILLCMFLLTLAFDEFNVHFVQNDIKNLD